MPCSDVLKDGVFDSYNIRDDATCQQLLTTVFAMDYLAIKDALASQNAHLAVPVAIADQLTSLGFDEQSSNQEYESIRQRFHAANSQAEMQTAFHEISTRLADREIIDNWLECEKLELAQRYNISWQTAPRVSELTTPNQPFTLAISYNGLPGTADVLTLTTAPPIGAILNLPHVLVNQAIIRKGNGIVQNLTRTGSGPVSMVIIPAPAVDPAPIIITLPALDTGPAKPPSGCIGWWKGDGNATNYIGTTADAEIRRVGYAPGLSGQAFQLLDNNSYVKTGLLLPYAGAGLSVEAWIRPSGAGGIFGDGGGMNPTPGQPPAEGIGLFLSDGTLFAEGGEFDRNKPYPLNFQPTSHRKLRMGEWYHVAMTWDYASQLVVLYTDGDEVGRDTAQYLPPRGSTDLTIGANPFLHPGVPITSFQGLVDDLRVYKRALAPREVREFAGRLRKP